MAEEKIEQQDVTMGEEYAEPEDVEEEEEEEEEQDFDKIKILPGASEDGTAASFQIMDEDHTLGNALKQMIIKNPEVEFCGYSIPHPSETKLHLRIQTYGKITAVEALHKGLDDLADLCTVVENKFSETVSQNNYSTVIA